MAGFIGNFLKNKIVNAAYVLALLPGLVLLCGVLNPADAASFGKPDLTNHRTYMVNGLASAVPNIGYGLKNLQRKLGGRYYAYMTPIEASGMEYTILKNIVREYRKNPHIKINIIGVSYGGNIATWLARRLAFKKIPVNYLGVIDAPAPSAVRSNVHRADNFRCRKLGCIGAPLRRASRNSETIMNSFTYRLSHIRLPNDKRLQQRIVGQLTDTPLFGADDWIVEEVPVEGEAQNPAGKMAQSPRQGLVKTDPLPINDPLRSGYAAEPDSSIYFLQK